MPHRAVFITAVAWISLVFLPMVRLWAQDVALPPSDVLAPTVQHEPLAETASVGQPIEISATVTDDDTGVKAVMLFYRHKDASRYSSLTMRQVGTSNNYMAAIPGKDVREPSIEYFIEAADHAGNRRLRGFKFEPLMINVGAPVAGPSTEEPEIVVEKDSPKKKIPTWTYVLIGVGAVALIGAAAGGGGGGGNGGGSGDLEITADVPQ